MTIEEQVAEETRRIWVYLQSDEGWYDGTFSHDRVAEGLANHLVRNRAQVEHLRIQLLEEALEAMVNGVGEAESDQGNLYCTSCATPGGTKGQHDTDCVVGKAKAALAVETEAKG